MLLRQRNVSQGMLNIPFPLLAIFYVALVAGYPFKNHEGLVQIPLCRASDVEDSSGNFAARRGAGQQIRVDNIVYIREIAALLPVPKNGWGLSVEHQRD